MKAKFALTVVAAALSTLVASHAQAGLLGSTVDSQYYAYGGVYNGGGSPANFIANGTVQNTFFNYYNLTVSDTQITYDFLSDFTWSPSAVSLSSGGLFITNGNLLTFTGAPTITSVSLDGSSSVVPGFGMGSVTFNSSAVAVDWQNVSFHKGEKVVLNVNAVPEPETYALLLAGLGVVATIVRRRQRAA